MSTIAVTSRAYRRGGSYDPVGLRHFAPVTDSDDDQALKAVGENEGWIISYIDILTLLLTLFVVLFALDHFRPDTQPLEQLTLSVDGAKVSSEATMIQAATKKEMPPVTVATTDPVAYNTLVELGTAAEAEEAGTVTTEIAAAVEAIVQSALTDNPVPAPDTQQEPHHVGPFLGVTPPLFAGLLVDQVSKGAPWVSAAETDSSVMAGQETLEVAVDTEELSSGPLNSPATTLAEALADDTHSADEAPATATVFDSAGQESLKAAPDTAQMTAAAPEEPASNDSIALPSRRTALETLAEALVLRSADDRVDVAVLDNRIRLEISDHILFDVGSASLKAAGRDVLNELAAVIDASSMLIAVEGHTDNTPISTERFPSNWELSSARATNVTRFLIDKGIASERIRAVGYADTRPLADNTRASGRARNRRVSLILEDSPEPRSEAETTRKSRSREKRT